MRLKRHTLTILQSFLQTKRIYHTYAFSKKNYKNDNWNRFLDNVSIIYLKRYL